MVYLPCAADRRGELGVSLARIVGRALAGLIGLGGAATLVAFLDRISWVFEPLAFFRLQYAVLLAAASALALALRRFRLAALALALLAANLAVIAPLRGSPVVPPAGPDRVRLLVFNVNASNDRYDRLIAYARRVRPDLIGLTELTPAWARQLAPALAGFAHRQLAARADEYGLGLYSRRPLTHSRLARFPANGPQAIRADFSLGGRQVSVLLVHVHTPFAGQVHHRELEAIAAARAKLGRRLVVCGDFNTVPWASAFRRFASAAGLRDLYDGSWPAYSWPTWSPLLRLPLDHCLTSRGLTVIARRFGPNLGSDHFPLVVDLAAAG